jgi:HAMP domain-containing protein
MTEQQVMIVGAAMCAALLILAFTMLWVLRQLAKLKQAHEELSRQVLRGDGDIAGLCSAAIAVDSRLAEIESQIASLAQDFSLHQQVVTATALTNDQPELEGYAQAIQMIINGASAEELVKKCGMSRDEAMLLISVNRSKDLSR